MINITITAETAEELRNQLVTLIGQQPAIVSVWTKDETPAYETETTVTKPAPARTRAKVEKVAEPEAIQPKIEQSTEIISTGTFIAPEQPNTNITQSNDLLDSPAPALSGTIAASPTMVSNGQTSLLDTPAADNKELKPGEIITLNDVRNKIAKAVIAGTITKPKVTDFLANYETSKGQPCTIPSDIQEKDYALVYNAIDFI